MDEAGAVNCSAHDSLSVPPQPGSPVKSDLLRPTDSLKDVQLILNFLEGGLHDIINIEKRLSASNCARIFRKIHYQGIHGGILLEKICEPL
jgi:hypothetical protein